MKLGFQAKNSAGKVVQYGNGVSINTDDVIYIENGPDYHTYTFRIDRQNAPADAPIENLVLTPLPDGSYKELLVSYNLTIQEKQSLALGKVIDTEGKTTVTELAAGTFNGNGQLSGKSSVSCGWESETIWQACYTGEHNQSNWQTWNECDWATHNGTPPKVYTIVVYRCHSVITADDHGSTGGGDHDSSGGGASAGSESSTPCTFATAYTKPQDLGLSSSPCPEGVPTEPNMGEPETPCEKTKNMLNRSNVQTGINNVKAQALNTLSNINAGEIGFKEKKDGTIVPADVNASHHVIFSDVTDSYGGYHNHTATGTHMFSPPDIDALFGFAAAQSIQDGVGNAYLGMIAAEWCNCPPSNHQFINYVITYTGTGAELGGYVYTAAQMNQFINKYQRKVTELSNTSLNGNTYIKNIAGDLNEKGLEKLFFETLKIMNLSGKVSLQRVESNGTVNNISLNNIGVPVGTPCP